MTAAIPISYVWTCQVISIQLIAFREYVIPKIVKKIETLVKRDC